MPRRPSRRVTFAILAMGVHWSLWRTGPVKTAAAEP